MVIRVGEHHWIVETRERTEGEPGATGEDFVDLVFRTEGAGEGRVELGWVPRPDPLTADLARSYFELAGRRRWTDVRSGRSYSVDLVDGGPDEMAEDAMRPLGIRFMADDGRGRGTVYPLARPLGLATDAELQAMVDVAMGAEDRRPRDRARPVDRAAPTRDAEAREARATR